jgi:hypothetical protein
MVCWAVLTNLSVAPGIKAPLGSTTVPEMLPPTDAHNGMVVNRLRTTTNRKKPADIGMTEENDLEDSMFISQRITPAITNAHRSRIVMFLLLA